MTCFAEKPFSFPVVWFCLHALLLQGLSLTIADSQQMGKLIKVQRRRSSGAPTQVTGSIAAIHLSSSRWCRSLPHFNWRRVCSCFCCRWWRRRSEEKTAWHERRHLDAGFICASLPAAVAKASPLTDRLSWQSYCWWTGRRTKCLVQLNLPPFVLILIYSAFWHYWSCEHF